MTLLAPGSSPEKVLSSFSPVLQQDVGFQAISASFTGDSHFSSLNLLIKPVVLKRHY